MVAVKAGDRIELHFAATSTSGELVATSAGGPALQMQAGGSDVIAGLSMGVLGMRVGESKTLYLSANEAFGAETPGVERWIASDRLPESVCVGDVVRISMAGMSALLWVVEESDAGFRVSTQHPLAGEPLQLDIELVALDPR